MMKKISFGIRSFLLSVAGVLGLIACQELHIDSQAVYPPKMETDSQTEYTVSAASPRTIVFNISSNTPWRIESDREWCTPSPAMSSAGSLIAEISVNIQGNPEEKERTATLTVRADEVNDPVIVTIRQDAKGKLHVQPVDDIFPAAGGSAVFTVATNKSWTIVSSRQWLTFDKSSGSGTGEPELITAIARVNAGGKRTATVTVSNGLEERTFEVRQNGFTLEFAEPADPENDLVFEGGELTTKTFEVIADIEWKAETEASWLTLGKDDAGNLTATTRSEIYFTDRTAVITLSAKDKTLDVEPVSLEVKQTGGEVDFFGTTHEIDEITGAVTFRTTGSEVSRYALKKKNKLAVYEWKFARVDVSDTRCIDMNCDGAGAPGWHMWLGEASAANNSRIFRTNGSDSQGNRLHNYGFPGLTTAEINAMRTLKVVFDYEPGNPANVVYEVYVDDKKIVDSLTDGPRNNPYAADPGPAGYVCYFGFAGGSSGAGSLTVDSFEVTPVH